MSFADQEDLVPIHSTVSIRQSQQRDTTSLDSTSIQAQSSSSTPSENSNQQKLSQDIFQLTNQVHALRKLVANIGVMDQDSPQLRSQIQETTENISRQIRSISAALKQWVQTTKNKLARNKLQKDFENTLTDFQSLSKIAAQKSKDFVLRENIVREQSNYSSLTQISDWKMNSSSDQVNNNKNAFIQSATRPKPDGFFTMLTDASNEDESEPLLSKQTITVQPLDNEISFNEALIAEREADLLLVEKSVAQVNEIFRDLGTLVHEQEYMLDNIEANVASVGVNVENATGELRTAARHQRNATRKWAWFLGIALIVLLLLVLSMRPWKWA